MNHTVGLSLAPLSLTPEELEALAAFRLGFQSQGGDGSAPLTFEVATAALPDTGYRPLDDTTLFRFLAADKRRGKFDPEASMARLVDTLEWRKKNSADDITASPPTEFGGVSRYSSLRVRRWIGVDKQNRPVQVERLGEFFQSGNVRSMPVDAWVRFYIWDLEQTFYQMRKASEECGQPVHKYTFMADLQGVVSSLPFELGKVVPLISHLAKTVETRYPEIVEFVVLFNAPRIFAGIYNSVAKKFLDPVTASKVEIHAGVPTERLLELVEAEVLPIEYGGKNSIDYPHTESAKAAPAE